MILSFLDCVVLDLDVLYFSQISSILS